MFDKIAIGVFGFATGCLLLAGCKQSVVEDKNVDAGAAWHADPFGNCCNTGASPLQYRAIQCRSVWDSSVLDDSACAQTEKPCQAAACACGTMECADDPETCPAYAGSATLCPGSDATGPSTFVSLGCMEDPLPPLLDAVEDAYDESCMNCTGDESCHGGLPFYRKRMIGASPMQCVNFCMERGLDLAGITASGAECRCGASPLNSASFKNEPRACIQLDHGRLFASPSAASCPVSIYRYAGHYEARGVPFDLTGGYAQDTTYVDEVGNGHPMADDSAFVLDETVEPGLMASSGFSRNCWPDNCGPGSGPWTRRQRSPPSGVADEYEEYVIVKYAFDTNIDQDRKAAFREAAKRWRSATCLNLVEEGNVRDKSSFDLQVAILDPNTCYVERLGNVKKYGSRSVSRINLGWCNKMTYVGSIVHEIGHVFGMNHEQKRPDATRNYYGHGPYLKMNWQNIESKWVPQWTPDESSYTGSANDGAGDPHSGYAPYDFGSIMHYPLRSGSKTFASTIPAGKTTGNRKKLSKGDIEQMKDTYQCKRRSGSPTPSVPTPPPTYIINVPTPAPPGSCRDLDANCLLYARSGHCYSNLRTWMSRNCRASCGLCGGHRDAACSWHNTTATVDQLECTDGTLCFGWDCCAARGGRAKCPPNVPKMCNKQTCGGGTQYCCSVDCSDDEGERECV